MKNDTTQAQPLPMTGTTWLERVNLRLGLAHGQHSEPAPEGEFAMTLRACGPKEELIHGDGSPPPVKIGKG